MTDDVKGALLAFDALAHAAKAVPDKVTRAVMERAIAAGRDALARVEAAPVVEWFARRMPRGTYWRAHLPDGRTARIRPEADGTASLGYVRRSWHSVGRWANYATLAEAKAAAERAAGVRS